MIAGNFVSLPICCIHPSSATYFAAGTSHVGLTADDACLESDTGNMQSTVAGNCVVRVCWKHQDLYKHWEFQSWCHCRENFRLNLFENVRNSFSWKSTILLSSLLCNATPIISYSATFHLQWFDSFKKIWRNNDLRFQVPAVCMLCKWDYKAKVLGRTRSSPSVRVAQFWTPPVWRLQDGYWCLLVDTVLAVLALTVKVLVPKQTAENCRVDVN